jgi:D-lactate dehydrogenase (cytochrome)
MITASSIGRGLRGSSASSLLRFCAVSWRPPAGSCCGRCYSTAPSRDARSSKTADRLALAGAVIVGASLMYAAQNFVVFRAVRPEAAAEPTIALRHHKSTTALEEVELRFNLSDENLKGAREELVALLGPGGVSDDLGTRISHSSTDWSPAPRGELDRPSLVVYPQTTDEVSKIAKICHGRRIPMIGFSGGTSLEGSLAATKNEICIDFGRMDRVIALHKDDMDVVVQPGVGYEELNQQLAHEGLFFPPDPGPGAKIGGMISQSCSGTNAYRYGTMKDWVLGLTIVLADGTILKTRHRPRKSNAGYDLTRLFVGSEGTLGFITEASLKLTNRPENVRVAVAAFPSLRQASSMAVEIVQSGHPLAAMELLDDVTMRAVNEGGYTDRQWAEVSTLFLKFSGTSAQVKEQISEIQSLAKTFECMSFDLSENDDEAEALWVARKTALWGMLALKEDPDDQFISADACVPISRLGDIIHETKRMIVASGLVGSCLGHVGDGV